MSYNLSPLSSCFPNQSSGCQPLYRNVAAPPQPLMGFYNGEIYNWRFIQDGSLAELCFPTTCDSEAILKLYEKMNDQPEFEHELCLALDGVFAFAVIYGDEFMAARDPIGVKPLYWGTDAGERKLFSSEMKVIEDSCDEMAAFPPGHFYLDSSLISTIAARALRGSDHPLRSFSIGLDREAPDAVAARKIAHFLGTQHHECYFSVQEGIELITQLIWHLETYDVTSIRASTPMYFLFRHISKMGIKVVLSGEGADEIFGGYLYFHNAPDDAEFQKETIRRMEPGKTERPMEKWILRKAFEDKVGTQTTNAILGACVLQDDPFLPDEILWRQKEQFSDGVGYGWIDELIDHCSAQISDEEVAEFNRLKSLII
uniref:Glutamine amidotransferase type-2 domain-containing protein n=1 Tax=Globodera pallida TaxID=36090 RepID=A0A183C134_GLOPA